jgi:hypothetical protein
MTIDVAISLGEIGAPAGGELADRSTVMMSIHNEFQLSGA